MCSKWWFFQKFKKCTRIVVFLCVCPFFQAARKLRLPVYQAMRSWMMPYVSTSQDLPPSPGTAMCGRVQPGIPVCCIYVHVIDMTSWCVKISALLLALLCWESTGNKWVPSQMSGKAEDWWFVRLLSWTLSWTGSEVDGCLRRLNDLIVLCRMHCNS